MRATPGASAAVGVGGDGGELEDWSGGGMIEGVGGSRVHQVLMKAEAVGLPAMVLALATQIDGASSCFERLINSRLPLVCCHDVERGEFSD